MTSFTVFDWLSNSKFAGMVVFMIKYIRFKLVIMQVGKPEGERSG